MCSRQKYVEVQDLYLAMSLQISKSQGNRLVIKTCSFRDREKTRNLRDQDCKKDLETVVYAVFLTHRCGQPKWCHDDATHERPIWRLFWLCEARFNKTSLQTPPEGTTWGIFNGETCSVTVQLCGDLMFSSIIFHLPEWIRDYCIWQTSSCRIISYCCGFSVLPYLVLVSKKKRYWGMHLSVTH